MRRNLSIITACLWAGLFVGCTTSKKPPQSIKLQPTSFRELKGWDNDHIGEAVPAFLNSCKIINKKPAHMPVGLGSVARDWHPICNTALFLDTQNHKDVRSFFEESFAPYKVFADSTSRGLFTGYFESDLRGSRKRTERYKHPLHGLPPKACKSSKHPSRKEILDGAIDHHDCVLVYVDDPVDAYFMHVQGSGRVYLEDGSVVRIGYAGQNGHPYSSLGQAIIEEEGLSKEIVSMQSLRRWLKDNPETAERLMNRNASYIFFRELAGTDGPIGAHGVPVTPRRSMAVDKRYIPLGVPLWLDIFHPENELNLRTLVVAQDTGGAIKGPVRGDFFWGHGPEAFHYAGMMKSRGEYYVLLPKTVKIPKDLLYYAPQS
jgi:membrane-bound lytic murein transglycosylase A